MNEQEGAAEGGVNEQEEAAGGGLPQIDNLGLTGDYIDCDANLQCFRDEEEKKKEEEEGESEEEEVEVCSTVEALRKLDDVKAYCEKHGLSATKANELQDEIFKSVNRKQATIHQFFK